MNILITGAKGMVGTALVNNLKNIRDGKNRTRPGIHIDNLYCYDIDSTPEQLDAWSDGRPDLEAWHRSFLSHDTRVAVEQGRVVGFADMDPSGYLDRLYVSAEHQREGPPPCATRSSGRFGRCAWSHMPR